MKVKKFKYLKMEIGLYKRINNNKRESSITKCNYCVNRAFSFMLNINVYQFKKNKN